MKRKFGKRKKSNGKNSKRVLFKRTVKSYPKGLGEIDEGKDELTSLKTISDAKMPKLAKEECLSELKNLNQ